MTSRHSDGGARLEDWRLLRGEGRFTDDIHPPGLLEAHVLRSPHAHARIGAVDVSRARALRGVHAVWTAADVGELPPMPMVIPDQRIIHPLTPRVLADERVRYVGEPVAFIVADTRYVAEDAAELVEVAYEPLPAVSAVAQAVAVGAARVHDQAEGNVAARDAVGFGEVDAALAQSAVVVRERLVLSRGSAQSMETRAIVARYDAESGDLTVWDTTQGPIPVRGALCGMLGLSPEHVRVIAGDIGGGFGPKMAFYAEEVLIPYAAIRLGRPVKWVEDRMESFVATTSEREQIHEVCATADAQGRLTGLRDHFLYETGAYIPYGLNIPFVTSMHLPGLYRLPAFEVAFEAVFTNRMFVSPYRGAGRPYAVVVIERVLDRIAEQLGLDPAEVRRRNLVRPDEMPYRYPLRYWDGGPLEHDSGDYPGLLNSVLAHIHYDALRVQQPQWRRAGRYLGVGLACYSEATGIGPYEGARVTVEPSGRITVATGVSSQGQGHETTLAHVVARRLGVPAERIAVTVGDTAAFQRGIGTFASRGAVTAGNAAASAADQVGAQARRWASDVLEAAEEDLELRDGYVQVKGAPELRIALAELAGRADPGRGRVGRAGEPFAPGLAACAYFNPQQATMAAGVHACVVEIDIATGQVALQRYVVAHDCGAILEPAIVEGQVVGGVAQGIGGALYERLAYDEAGQLLSGTYMDYLLPTASEIPQVELLHRQTPSPLNPLGVKGVGEAGAIPGHAVIAAAIEDALRPFGVRITELPIAGPAAIRDLIRAAQQNGTRSSMEDACDLSTTR